MIINCSNLDCSNIFESVKGSVYCPECVVAGKALVKEERAQFLNCRNKNCNKVFVSSGSSYFCPDCQKALIKEDPNESGKVVGAGLIDRICATPECKQLFFGNADAFLCPICERIAQKARAESDDDAYWRIKNFLNEHPHATIDEIHVYTKVSIYKIKKFLEEGKFQLVLLPKCTLCGKALTNGRYGQSICLDCSNSLKGTATPKNSFPSPVSPRSSGTPGKERKYGFGRD
ncbi:MAG: hypothetical protein K2X66_08080 [Cyanobacteria bacterium]|nr:hypothetical protein [Cyanobacteriota bacterium]